MKKHLLSLLCLLAFALPALADTYVILAKGATYSGSGTAKEFNAVPASYEGVATLSTSSYNSNSKEFRTNANTDMLITPAQGVTITKVTFTNTNNTTPTVKLNQGVTGTLSSSDKTFTWNGESSTAISINTTVQLKYKYVEIEAVYNSKPTTCTPPLSVLRMTRRSMSVL